MSDSQDDGSTPDAQVQDATDPSDPPTFPERYGLIGMNGRHKVYNHPEPDVLPFDPDYNPPHEEPPAEAPDFDPEPAPEPPPPPHDAESKKARAGRTLHLRVASTIDDPPTGWLWPRWISHGLVWLEGDQGTNKSMLAALLAALTTTGQPYPGETDSRHPRNVLYLSSGEDPDSTIRARFEKAGGNLSRFYLLDVRKIMTDLTIPESSRGLPELPFDAALIVATAESIDAALIVLDAAYSFVSTKHDIFNDHELRAALEPFARRVADVPLSALALRHTRKTEGPVQHQGLGAVAGGAVSRGVLVMNTNAAAGPNARLLGCIKSSYGAKPEQQLSFEVHADGPLGTAWLTYTGQSAISVSRASSASRNPKIIESASLYKSLHKGFSKAFEEHERLPIHGPDDGLNVEALARKLGYDEKADFGRSRQGIRLKQSLQVTVKQEREGKKPTWFWILAR